MFAIMNSLLFDNRGKNHRFFDRSRDYRPDFRGKIVVEPLFV